VIRRTLDRILRRQPPAGAALAGAEGLPASPTTDPEAAVLFPVALMHVQLNARLAPIVMLEPDTASDRSRAASERVIAAYRAAMRAPQAASPSMWAVIEGQHADFFKAVRAGDVATVQGTLARLFDSPLVWGLGRVHPDTPSHIRGGQPHGVQIQVADAIVSLAEATGTARVTCIEQQGIDRHLTALDTDLDTLVDAVVARTGLDVEMPACGGNYGCEIAGRRVSIDSLVHAYTPYRLRQLGVGAAERIAEIGGGYGCLSYVCRRNGFRDYAVYDLPWVNLLQGYLLLMNLPADEVSLCGEPPAAVNVRPFWEFAALPDRSVDVVINTDSLPEMGEETGRRYIADIARVTRRGFLSINQEAMAEYPGVGRQLHVNGMAAEQQGLRLLHRHRYWMRQGYVEEWFVPAKS
jgi:hypothetical protein